MILRSLAAVALLFALAGCGRTAGTAAPAGDEQHRRIVSLIPSLTEDLFAIGAGAQVVGISMFTDYPPQAKKLPVVASFNSVDAERIVTLRPDLVVGISSQNRMLDQVRKLGIAAITFSDDSYADIFKVIEGLGVFTGRVDDAVRLSRALQARTRSLRASVTFKHRPAAFIVLGVGPIYTVGKQSYLHTLVEMAGGRNAAAVAGAYSQYSEEAILAAQPDIIITDKQSGLIGVLDREPWRSLRAVRLHHVYVAPALLERPGPRYNEGLAWLITRFKQVQ